jgi:HK97 family phage portal protein
LALFRRRLERRELEQVTDIGLAFTARQAELLATGDETIPAVYRSSQVIADTVASLGMVAVGGDGIAEPVTPAILELPNPAETYQATMAKIVSSLIWRGNAYLWVRERAEATGEVSSIYVLNPDEVTVQWDTLRLYPVYSWRNREMVEGRDLFHLAINHWPGRVTGLGPVEAARLMMIGIKAEQATARHLYENDAAPSGVLQVPQRLEAAEAAKVLEAWELGHTGTKRPAVLSGGVEFKPLTLTPADAEFLAERAFSVQEIARMFGLFGLFLLVDDGGNLTYSTTEGLFRLFIATTLRPTYLEPIEQTFSRMLAGRTRAQFVTAELLEADLTSRYAAYETGLRAGFLTVDEVRRLEHLPKMESRPPAPAPVPIPAGEGGE